MDLYIRQPLRVDNGIPVFCEDDEYTKCYDSICQQHLRHHNSGRGNPWQSPEKVGAADDLTHRFVAEYMRDGARVLDVGVGVFAILSTYPKTERYGADVSLGYLQRAKELGANVCRANAESLPYCSGFFDVVVATDVMEHVIDITAAMREAVRVLKPGGVLVVRSPCREDLRGYASLGSAFKFCHMRTFDQWSLWLLLAYVGGLKILRHDECDKCQECICLGQKPNVS